MTRTWVAWSLLVLGSGWAAAEGPDLAYRTDTANQQLPWYALKPGEFPPLGSEHAVDGELLEADFLRRTGQFRTAGTGELVDFTLLPFGTVLFENAEADLRDVPLGTWCRFSLYQDGQGHFTRAAAIHDGFSSMARRGEVYRLDKLDLDAGGLEVTTAGGTRRLLVNGETRVWHSQGSAKLADLAVGDEFLANLASDRGNGSPRCVDLWVGTESRSLATENQHKRHEAFLRERGLPCWIDAVEGKRLTVTLFGDPPSLEALGRRIGLDWALWPKQQRSVHAVVATEELRSFNPPVDGKQAKVREFQPIATASHGCGGIRWVIEPDLLLEGFRKGRIIRLFAHHSWPIHDMPFGEGVYTEAAGVRPLTEDPWYFPYRTDFANETLPWYTWKSHEFPPLFSDHRVRGTLVAVDPAQRAGQFREDESSQLVRFTMPPFGFARALGVEVGLEDLPLGTRYEFSLYRDESGAFTKAAVITDQATRFRDGGLTYRVDSFNPSENRLDLATRHVPVKDDKDAIIQPPDYGRGRFAVGAETRVWKGDGRADLASLAVGEEVLANLGGRSTTSRGVCTDLWIGEGTWKHDAEAMRSRHEEKLRREGMPGWIDGVEGNVLTVTFFAASRKDFLGALEKDVKGDEIDLVPATPELRPTAQPPVRFYRTEQAVTEDVQGVYGWSGVRWKMKATGQECPFRQGEVVRMMREGWGPPPDSVGK